MKEGLPELDLARNRVTRGRALAGGCAGAEKEDGEGANAPDTISAGHWYWIYTGAGWSARTAASVIIGWSCLKKSLNPVNWTG